MNQLNQLAHEIESSELSSDVKQKLLLGLTRLKDTKINILITGATGCGKSSTINALFGEEKAKVGQTPNPETMDIQKYQLDSIVLWDSPGLGDGKDSDRRHAKGITDLLYKQDDNGDALIDLVLVILDGSSRDLGTSYELINNVIIPALGDNAKDRLLVAINQCDVAMKGRNWNHAENKPEPELVKFLEEKVESTRNRIKEATGVDIQPIYYSAGYKDGDSNQQPYNLSKLLMFMVEHTKPEKRAVYVNDINRDKRMWEKDDELEDYRNQTQQSILSSIAATAKEWGDVAGSIGGIFGLEKPARLIGSVAGALWGGFKSLFGW